jgi:hypothetical protein
MNKSLLIDVIEKYHLNNTVESAKWTIKDKKLNIRFITPNKNLIGEISAINFDLTDCEIGIYNTAQLLKLIKVTDEYIELSVNKGNYGKALELLVKDNQFDLSYYLSDLSLIEEIPEVNEPISYDAIIETGRSFAEKFMAAKKALGDIKRFTVKSHKVDGNTEILFTLGDNATYTNKIKFSEPSECLLGMNEVPFPIDYFNDILDVNKLADSGTIKISDEGLLTISFKEGFVESKYFLVRLQ